MANRPDDRHGERVTTTPHDALFKATFAKVHHARGLLRAIVPAPLAQRIAWPTLRLESGIAVGGEDLQRLLRLQRLRPSSWGVL